MKNEMQHLQTGFTDRKIIYYNMQVNPNYWHVQVQWAITDLIQQFHEILGAGLAH